MRAALLYVLAASALSAQQPRVTPNGGTRTDTMARAVASLIRLQPGAFPEIPKNVRQVLELRRCLIPQRHASSGDTTAAVRKAEFATRENALHGQFFERGSFAWAVLCSARGITSIVFVPDDATLARGPSGNEVMELSAAPDSAWVERDDNGGWRLNPTIYFAGAPHINRTHDGARLDRSEAARPVHDGLVIADPEGSGYTIYWTGRRWIQVASYH